MKVLDELAEKMSVKRYKTYQEQLQCPEWKERARQIKVRDNYICQICGIPTDKPEAHHIAYIPGRMAWDHPDNFMICVCPVCHKEEESRLASMRESAVSIFRMALFLTRDMAELLNCIAGLSNQGLTPRQIIERLK